MARTTSVERVARWRGILRRQAGSGLSIRAFCEREGISQPSFFSLRRRLREAGDEGVGSESRGTGPAESDGEGLFVPLQLVGSAASLEIWHPLGYRVRVTGEVSREALRQVMDVLDERPRR